MTLNDVVFVEAAQKSPAPLHASHPDDPTGQLAQGLETAFLKPPTPAEIEPLRTLYETTLDHYQTAADDAAQMAGNQRFGRRLQTKPPNSPA